LREIILIILTVLLGITFSGCGNTGDPDPVDSRNSLVVGTGIVTYSFIGNGVQWGGYDMLESWTGSPTLSASDWEKLFKRVRFMRPPLVRIMGAPGWNYMKNGMFDPSVSENVLVKILDFCQAENIGVVFGEWGHSGGTAIDTVWLGNSVRFLKWLLVDKNYTCIRYYNMVNEPNGSWSTINGNFSLWQALVEEFYARLEKEGIASKIKIIGPDVAVWDTNLLNWVGNTSARLDKQVGIYDIHTYPDETAVRDGETYAALIRAYKNEAPASKEMLMAEFGFKYNSSSDLGKENQARISADPYASDDSNMLTSDAFYGVDVADAIIQNMRAGYSGVIVWDMDDAMYNVGGSGSTKLKRWGFWNILGQEKFGNPGDENIRPWFYTVSLLCRYFPNGSEILGISLPDKKGLRAVAGMKDGKCTIAIVNSNYVDYQVDLKSEQESLDLKGLKTYRFVAGKNASFTGATDADGLPLPESEGTEIDLSEGSSFKLDVPGQSFILITNLD